MEPPAEEQILCDAEEIERTVKDVLTAQMPEDMDIDGVMKRFATIVLSIPATRTNVFAAVAYVVCGAFPCTISREVLHNIIDHIYDKIETMESMQYYCQRYADQLMINAVTELAPETPVIEATKGWKM